MLNEVPEVYRCSGSGTATEDSDTLLRLVNWDGVGDTEDLARISADGTCTFYWDRIEVAAGQWAPYCTNMATCCAKLLWAAKQQGEIRERT